MSDDHLPNFHIPFLHGFSSILDLLKDRFTMGSSASTDNDTILIKVADGAPVVFRLEIDLVRTLMGRSKKEDYNGDLRPSNCNFNKTSFFARGGGERLNGLPLRKPRRRFVFLRGEDDDVVYKGWINYERPRN
ncbi:serine/threonine-protein kinase SRK2I-like [Gossypium australe]|uniref:Serine/threonine-protein kinase SRK2I-like n=1 Tax=Gossypium australe TaxID=47621 RepID=A0A5B6UX69_9ROSI|nr:serine/threonine-protein kinase SRK2I-like [Gossypium australe]